MIKRFYIYNFRCLESFEFLPEDRSSILLVGRNGAGKSTFFNALEKLQLIGRGITRVQDLVTPEDLTAFRNDRTMRFEIEVQLGTGIQCSYKLALVFSRNEHQFQVKSESLHFDSVLCFERNASEVRMPKANNIVEFGIDSHQVALPVIQGPMQDKVSAFLEWLRNLTLLHPIPRLIGGESRGGSLQVDGKCLEFAAWFRELNSQYPASYSTIIDALKPVMPDLSSIRNPPVGKDSKQLEFVFNGTTDLVIPFDDLSDGEKCLVIAAQVVAASQSMSPMVCGWDVPDSHISLPEVGHFILELRRAFRNGGQFIATSHNPEAIRRFSSENTLLLYRNSHSEPTLSRWANEMYGDTDLADVFIRGEDPANENETDEQSKENATIRPQ